MKKILKFGFPFLAASILLSACGDVEEEENGDVEVEDVEEVEEE
ncbi:hypothetical protein ACSU6B_23195 [Neobacillus sp. C211]